MTRIDIDLLRYGSRGAVYRVNNDSRMLIAESRVPACDAARGAAGREFSGTRPYANDRRAATYHMPGDLRGSGFAAQRPVCVCSSVTANSISARESPMSRSSRSLIDCR